ncbi:MAG TPA: hypothetical protein VM689_10405 [Aliidongia sp.]|nr:hypothetical protein [Aliidongia sp.]
MKKTLLVAAIALGFGSGTAYAAGSCPAFPAPTIKFEALPGTPERDTSKTAKEISAAAGDSSDKWRYESYNSEVTGTMSRKVAMQQLPGGAGMCGGLAEVTIKLGFKRQIAVAKEAADNGCVADAFASQAEPVIKNEDATLAAFGASLATTYKADIAAIGTIQGADQDAVQGPIRDKLSALFNDKVYPAFEKQVTEGRKSIDLKDWKPADCNGDTKKVVASLSGTPAKNADTNSNTNVAPQQPRQPTYSGGR